MSMETPIRILTDLSLLSLSSGEDPFFKNNVFKKFKEKWIAAVFCYGISKLTRKNWFVEITPEDPPDFVALTTDRIMLEKFQRFTQIECEIVECPDRVFADDPPNAEEAVFQHVERTKFSRKSYPSNYNLIVFFNFKCRNFSLDKLRAYMKDKRPALGQIWALIFINDEKYLVTELFPDSFSIQVDLAELQASVINMINSPG